MKTPSSLLYGVADRPPLWIVLLHGLQHICSCAVALVFPVMIMRAIGGTTEETSFLVSMSMAAGG